ncbi:MAG: histidinol-phosphate transaminase [Alphaproteobacteria bacterium]|nr:histidinol-phosphate transaminase [Alphaproteobacteria bacterium]MBU1515746.1 histidinol-phosphate transaminase [Alphaproteobacteria bacterium]MBU2097029.1 histidinol-phosphate transaminase [Alphaproteobacteria bacterium]MBU2149545.1 histidinol-phosphate transaminase [Alphaproteobacteria bacterium]MBU2308931.1 histidinol-phosphate transaminase [Alphaproteobacteria bacterium]
MTDAAEPLDRAKAAKPVPKPGILDIHAYVPGKAKADGVENPIKLSANENILGSSPKAREAFVSAADEMQVYPDSRTGILRDAIAQRFRLEPERLIFGCGSDEVFALLNQAFLEPGDNIVQGEYGFAAFAIGAHACQAQVKLAREPGYRIDVDEMLKTVDDRTRLMFLANPGNPTGTWIPFSEVLRLHAALPPSVILVLDGAYSEFATDPAFQDGLDFARGTDNIVVTHTFSKLHGLAALRVGWGYAPAEIAAAVDRIRLPFNTSIAGQRAAVAALADDDFQARSIAHVDQWRAWLAQQLGGLGLEIAGPSATNFVLAGFPRTAGKTAGDADDFLSARGLLTRRVLNYGLPDHLRITIGLEEHNRAVVDALSAFMKA